MTPFYLRERKEKWTIYTLPSVCISPILFLIHFRHATYKENVVKNQELFQVCDHFFSFFISLTLIQQWIINCLVLFSITISLWTGIKLVAHVIVLTNSSLTWNPDAWLILYSLFSTDALLKLWRHEELRGLYKVTLICIGWQLFDWLIKLKIEIILTVCAGLVVKYAGYWSLIKSIKSKKSQVVCTAPCVP